MQRQEEEDFKAIEALFNPKSIAVIGASEDERKFSGKLVRFLFKHGFKNKVYPINPKRTEVWGLKCYSSLKDVPDDIDLACILIPYDTIPQIVEECAEKRVKAGIIYSSGFAEAIDSEIGVKGVELQNEITKRARRSGIRISGPNCIGIISPVSNICLSFSPASELQPIVGDIAVISQSGALGGSILTRLWERGIGISRFISSGNEADLQTADYVKYLTRDPFTKVMVTFIEGVRDGKKFREAAEMAYKAMKPIVVFKTGKSEIAKLSVRSHTGSLAGNDQIYDAIFRQLGLIRAQNIEELIDIPMALSWQPLPRGNKVGVISVSGGACSIVADKCEENGLDIPNFSEDTAKKVRKLIPRFVSGRNPLDITGMILPGGTSEPGLFMRCIEEIAKDDLIDTILIIMTTTVGPETEIIIDDIIKASKRVNELGKPILLIWVGARSYVSELVNKIAENRIPLYDTPEKAMRAAGAMVKYQSFLKKKRIVS